MTEDREWLTAHLVDQAAYLLRLSQAAAARPHDASLLLGVRDEVFALRETLDTLGVPLARASTLEWNEATLTQHGPAA